MNFDANSASSGGAALISDEPSPILTGQTEARACDWTVEGKVGLGVLEREKRREEEGRQGDEEREEDKDEVEGRWSRSMWLGEATSSKGSRIWGTE